MKRLLVALAAASFGPAQADEALLAAMAQPWTGDLDGMIERRAVRALVTPSRNPNVWFNNVEQIAAERIGAETVTYVSNIYKYYVAYKLTVEIDAERERERKALKKKP